jgi:hypothetical protein
MIDGDKVATIVEKEGLRSDNISDIFEMIGMFESLKQKELVKLNTLMRKHRIADSDDGEREDG